jgi:hypothetical protein
MPASTGRLLFSHYTLAVLLCAAASAVSCSSLQVPVNFPGFNPAQLSHSSSDGINFAIKPITSRQEYQEIFDDYLPEVGLAAIWIQVRNNRSAEITLASEKWRLQIGERTLKQLDTSAVLKRYYHGRNIRIYTVNADLGARRNLENLMISSGRIASSMEFSGLIFFQVDKTLLQNWNKGAVLINKDIYLDNGKKVKIRLPLAYANP